MQSALLQKQELLSVTREIEQIERKLLIAKSLKDPYFWLTETTKTVDPQAKVGAATYRPFPKDRPYIRPTLRLLENESVVFLEKSRTMLGTWMVSGWAAHHLFTKPGTEVIVTSADLDRALRVVQYVKILWKQSIPELRDLWPTAGGRAPEDQAKESFELKDSMILAIPGNPDKIASSHPKIFIVDEAPMIEHLESVFNVAGQARPKHMVLLGSLRPGWFRNKTKGAVPVDWPDYGDENEDDKRLRSKARSVYKNWVQTARPEAQQEEESRVGIDGHAAEIEIWPKSEPKFGFRPWAFPRKMPCPGVYLRRTSDDIAVLSLHYSADPTLTVADLEELARGKTKEYWLREMEGYAEAHLGQLVYPTFGPEHIVTKADLPEKLCRYMAIDPHVRTPHAMLWVGVDAEGDFWVYREAWPCVVYGEEKNLTNTMEQPVYRIKDYVRVIANLEGNRVRIAHEGAADEYGVYDQQQGGEVIIDRYMDQAGKGFMATGETETPESQADRYKRLGISCRDPLKRHSAGEDAIRELMVSRPHGTRGRWPRLHILDTCHELMLELRIARYKQLANHRLNQQELPQGIQPVRTHMIDLLRYLATADLWYSPKLASRMADTKFNEKEL